jgi:hypothetical protein
MKWKLGLVVCSALVVSAANGTNAVRIWYKSDPNGASVIDNAVKITAAGTYKIEAVTTPGSSLGYVDDIYIDPNGAAVNGDVFVYVVRNPKDTGNDPHQPGVTQLKEVNLTNVTSGHVGNLVEVRCTSHLGALGPIVASNISDTLYVGGNVLDDIEITGNIINMITITGFLKAHLSCESLHDLTVSGVGSSMFAPPDITINSSYGHHMTVHQNVDTLSFSGANYGGVVTIDFDGYDASDRWGRTGRSPSAMRFCTATRRASTCMK